MPKTINLKAKSAALRRDILDIVYSVKSGHIGGDMSVVDILNVLYNAVMDITPENFESSDRDHFLLSKGHCVEALYAVLADKGFFPKEALKTVSAFGSKYIGHPTNRVSGIEMNSGSLGHGLSIAVGMAKALRMDKKPHRVYVVMGDGELAEGSVWEGAMAAGHFRLDNLIAVVDRNRLQISGSTEQVMGADDVAARFESFGWRSITVKNGNDTDMLLAAFDTAKVSEGSPVVIVAETTKGCGVSFMENQAEWHHKVPDAEQYGEAVKQLTEQGGR